VSAAFFQKSREDLTIFLAYTIAFIRKIRYTRFLDVTIWPKKNLGELALWGRIVGV